MTDQDAYGRKLHRSLPRAGEASRSRSEADRKARITHRILGSARLLGRRRIVNRDQVARQPSQRRSQRQINLNKASLQLKGSGISSEVSSSRPLALRATFSNLKRRHDPSEADEPKLEEMKNEDFASKGILTMKKQKQSTETGETADARERLLCDENKTDDHQNLASKFKTEREKQRQKKKKKRQKAEKQAGNEEHQSMMEKSARQAEAESSEPRRFLVAMPLASIGGLSGGSVCKHFRKNDLTLNDILPVPIQTLLASLPARVLYESLQGPIYFSVSCAQDVIHLKQRLKSSAVCSKLLVISEDRFNEVQGVSVDGRLPRLLGKQTLTAIEQVLEDAQPPHELESSQNAEDKIKCLFKPILRSLGLQDTIITTGFSWREKIGLRSSIDLGTHGYAPKSDAAIIKLLNDKEAKILVLFEAYSRLGQSLNTPDENRADRVRLLIQGSYISIRDEKPSVVFYLTQDKHMETILIFAVNGDQSKFGYYAEKQLFYSEVAWVDLVCQIINLI